MVLESSGLINTIKAGRVHTRTLGYQLLALVDDLLAEQRDLWESDLKEMQ